MEFWHGRAQVGHINGAKLKGKRPHYNYEIILLSIDNKCIPPPFSKCQECTCLCQSCACFQ
jgi:hypothetical protein